AVHEPGLRVAERLALVERRRPYDACAAELRDAVDRLEGVRLPIPQIRADSDVGMMRQAGPRYRWRPRSRSTASRSRSTGLHSVRRMYPSPASPKPFPGVTTTPASVRQRVASAAAVVPRGTGTQT